MVGNLRNVVSWSSFLAGLTLLITSFLVWDISAQEVPPADPVPVAEAAETLATPPVAAGTKAPPVVYAEPLITEKDDKDWKSKRQVRFQNAQKAIAPTNAETKELEDGAKIFIDRMSIPKYLRDLNRNAIEPARRSVDGPLTQPNPRKILLKAMTERSVELLAQNPPHHPDVQLGVVILLGTLNAQPAGTSTAAVPYTGSAKALIGVLEDPTRPLQCRILAALGLGRMGRESAVGVIGGDLSVVQRAEIASSLAKVLVASDSQGLEDGQVWFRDSLAKALGDCGVAIDLNGGSGFIDALMITATNPVEHLRVRAASLRAVSQLSWNGTTNVPLILHETMELVLEIAQTYNTTIAANQGPVPVYLNRTNMVAYLCFRPETTQQATILKWGLLNQISRPGVGSNGPAVTTSYAAALPVINHILSNPKKPVAVPAPLIAAIQAWIQSNPPQNRKPTTVSPNPVP